MTRPNRNMTKQDSRRTDTGRRSTEGKKEREEIKTEEGKQGDKMTAYLHANDSVYEE